MSPSLTRSGSIDCNTFFVAASILARFLGSLTASLVFTAARATASFTRSALATRPSSMVSANFLAPRCCKAAPAPYVPAPTAKPSAPLRATAPLSTLYSMSISSAAASRIFWLPYSKLAPIAPSAIPATRLRLMTCLPAVRNARRDACLVA